MHCVSVLYCLQNHTGVQLPLTYKTDSFPVGFYSATEAHCSARRSAQGSILPNLIQCQGKAGSTNYLRIRADRNISFSAPKLFSPNNSAFIPLTYVLHFRYLQFPRLFAYFRARSTNASLTKLSNSEILFPRTGSYFSLSTCFARCAWYTHPLYNPANR